MEAKVGSNCFVLFVYIRVEVHVLWINFRRYLEMSCDGYRSSFNKISGHAICSIHAIWCSEMK